MIHGVGRMVEQALFDYKADVCIRLLILACHLSIQSKSIQSIIQANSNLLFHSS